MRNDMASLFLDNIKNKNYDDADHINELFRIAVDAINQHTIGLAKEDLVRIDAFQEVVSQVLKFDSNVETQKAYYYGMMQALAILLLRLDEDSEEDRKLMALIDRFGHLKTIVTYLMQEGRADGPELRSVLRLNSRSSLSNLMRAIKEERLIYTEKIGVKNYYTLTRKGERCAKLAVEKDENQEYRIKNATQYVTFLLQNIVEASNIPTSNALSVLTKTQMDAPNNLIEETALIKISVEKIIALTKRRHREASLYFSLGEEKFWPRAGLQNKVTYQGVARKSLPHQNHIWNSILEEEYEGV